MKMHCYGQDSSGKWVPLLVDQQGSIGGGGGLVPERWSYAAASGGIVNTSDVTLVAAAGTNRSNYISSFQYLNKDATVATEVVIKDDTTIIWRGWAPAAMTSPASVVFDTPIASSANKALNAAAITTSAELYVNAQGYREASLLYMQAQATLEIEIFDDNGELLFTDSGAQIYLG